MKQQDWTDQLRERMADYEADVPEGLWADIEKSLPQQKAKVVPLWRRLASVAAQLALIVSISWWLWPDASPTEKVISRQGQSIIKENSPTPAATVIPTQNDTHAITCTSRFEVTAKVEETVNTEEYTVHVDTSGFVPQPQTAEESSPTEQTTHVVLPASTPEVLPHPKSSPRVIIGLHAKSGLLAYNNSNGVPMSDERASRYNYTDNLPTRATTGEEPIWLAGYEEHQHHDHPIALGLTASYPLNKYFSLSTGLVYTRLHSEFTNTMKQTRISTEQTLHYLGVPLSLQYYIKKSNTWKAYISGGAEIDWNISAKSVTEGVNTSARKDRAQWSLGAGVGIEYDILPQLGIYAEPGFRYYLNNGSTVQNFFKDQPASWSLEFGVRLNLNTP